MTTEAELLKALARFNIETWPGNQVCTTVKTWLRERNALPAEAAPSKSIGEYLLGEAYLAKVAARLVIGRVAFDFPESPKGRYRKNPDDDLDSLNFSDWVLPTDRPVTRWW